MMLHRYVLLCCFGVDLLANTCLKLVATIADLVHAVLKEFVGKR
jgi:hypothetical protein